MADRTMRPKPGMVVRAWVDTTDGTTIHTDMRIDRVTRLGCGCHRLDCIRPGPRDQPPRSNNEHPDVHVLTGDCPRHAQVPPVQVFDGPIVCAGRDVDDHGRHVGDDCPRVFRPRGIHPATEQARAAGWAIGRLPDGSITATCPRCRRPDPDTAAACRDLAATTEKGATP